MRVFLDASVVFSGFMSPTGGSYKIISLCREKHIIGISTQTIIQEVKRNIHKAPKSAEQLDQFISSHRLLIRSELTLSEIEVFKSIVAEKDAHVLAGAILTISDYLVTLDKLHLLNSPVKNAMKSRIDIVSPGEFLESLL